MIEENNNIYVSSRGILKSCDYYSLTPQSSIRRLINYLPLETIKSSASLLIFLSVKYLFFQYLSQFVFNG